MRHWLWISARAILIGWPTLIAITLLLERPLLLGTARLLGASWFPTARLALACAGLAATGWVIGRLHRSEPILAVLVFAATLTLWDFDALLAINVPWLLRLAADALRDPLYFDSLVTTAGSHVLLFGSLIAGGFLSRPSAAPPSILSAL